MLDKGPMKSEHDWRVRRAEVVVLKRMEGWTYDEGEKLGRSNIVEVGDRGE